MKPLELSDILDLVQYEKRRKAVRAEMMDLKQRRRLPVNEFLTLLFENRRTVWYQIQEMARAERMVEDAAILGELEAYGALVPGSREWKTTLYIEIPDEARLKQMLPELPGIEGSFFARCGGAEVKAEGEPGRSREDYTSTVHYLTWPLGDEFVAALRSGAPLAFGTRHPFCPGETEAPRSLRQELLADLDADG
jgi:hypothetical protein